MQITIIDTMYFFQEHIDELKSLTDLIYHTSRPKDCEDAIERIRDAEIVINFWYEMTDYRLSKMVVDNIRAYLDNRPIHIIPEQKSNK